MTPVEEAAALARGRARSAASEALDMYFLSDERAGLLALNLEAIDPDPALSAEDKTFAESMLDTARAERSRAISVARTYYVDHIATIAAIISSSNDDATKLAALAAVAV